MSEGLTASNLRELAAERLSDAQLLLANDRFSSAYYLAGYAVELALKAHIARSFKAEAIPDRGFVNSVYVHNLVDLMRLAQLHQTLKQAASKDAELALNWATVSEWDVASRYATVSRDQCRMMVHAVGASKNGMFAWLQTHL